MDGMTDRERERGTLYYRRYLAIRDMEIVKANLRKVAPRWLWRLWGIEGCKQVCWFGGDAWKR